jgi:EAL domain-containing protein (putative c-di-GMP-specific phosphodiesterase class I)
MARTTADWADVPSGHDSPLNYAVMSRDRATIKMVDDALNDGRVLLAYQAVVPSRNTGNPAFYEGLIRILDKSKRILPAKDFIDAVEATEIGRKIDCMALKRGLLAMKRHPDLRLSVNMSARSIGYGRWSYILEKGIREDPTIAERLILEITESSAILVPELVVNFMNKLQKKGISFALDDFGSGYTSFQYLKEFYFDILKIDGQFIRGIAQNADNQIIARSMATLAKDFDMVSVAESVETAEDAMFLQQMGMDCLQGYFFGAPTVRPVWADDGPEQESA